MPLRQSHHRRWDFLWLIRRNFLLCKWRGDWNFTYVSFTCRIFIFRHGCFTSRLSYCPSEKSFQRRAFIFFSLISKKYHTNHVYHQTNSHINSDMVPWLLSRQKSRFKFSDGLKQIAGPGELASLLMSSFSRRAAISILVLWALMWCWRAGIAGPLTQKLPERLPKKMEQIKVYIPSLKFIYLLQLLNRSVPCVQKKKKTLAGTFPHPSSMLDHNGPGEFHVLTHCFVPETSILVK